MTNASAAIDRRHDGYYLQGRKLTLMDIVELKLPMIPGWCRGRFGVIQKVPVVALRNGQQVRLDLDLVDEVRWPEGTPSFTCPSCKRTSYNPNDVRELYCAACHESFL